MATTISNSPPRAREKSVSAGRGPVTFRPAPRAASIAGPIAVFSSSPNSPSSPAGHGRHVHVGEVEDLERPGLPAALRDACDAVQAERRADERGRLRQRRRSADDDGPARALNLGLGSRAHDDLRPHARGVAHRHAEDRVLHAASFWSETNRAGGPKPPALVSTGSTGWPGARM